MDKARIAMWTVVGLVLVGVIGIYAWNFYDDHQRAKMQEELQAASANMPNAGPGGRPQGPGMAGGPPLNGPIIVRARPAPTEQVLLKAPWGNGASQVGNAPMGVTAGPNNEIWIVDTANKRLAKFSAQGQPASVAPLDVGTPQELVQTPSGGWVVLDRTGDKKATVLGPDGKKQSEIPLQGKNLEDPAQVTGLTLDADGIYAQVGHNKAVKLAAHAGEADAERPALDGMPARDGKTLLAVSPIANEKNGLTVVAKNRADNAKKFEKPVYVHGQLLNVGFVDTDATGKIFIGAKVGIDNQGKLEDEHVELICLSPEGELAGAVRLPATTGASEPLKSFALRSDGELLYMRHTASGTEVMQTKCL